MEQLIEQFDIYNSNNYSNFYPSMDNLEECNISSVSLNLSSSYPFVCKKCGKIPKITSFKKEKIKIICSCSNSPKEILISEIISDYLNSSEFDINNLRKIFHCSKHKEEKTMFYCNNCKKNLCQKCINYCVENKHNCHLLKNDLQTINAFNYIHKKISEKLKVCEEENNINNQNDENHDFIIKKRNYDSIDEGEDFFLHIFSMIINDFNEYPTYENLHNIFFILDFITYYYDKHKEIKLFYKFDKNQINNNNIELFSNIFVNNNKENLFLVINDNIIELDTCINLKDIYEENIFKDKASFTLEVKLIEKFNRRVTDFSFMFYNIPLLNLSWDFSKFDTINIDNMSYMFYGCELLKCLPDISQLNTINVKKMQYMFYNCKSLISIPDISKWNTSNLRNISYMFYNCELLYSFSDISKWNINNIKKMDFVFHNCNSLKILPDISKLKIKNINNMRNIFYNYKFLTNILKIEHKERINKLENEKQILNNEIFKEQNYHETIMQKLKNENKRKLQIINNELKIMENYHEREKQKINNNYKIEFKIMDNYHERELQKINNKQKIKENYHERKLQKINNELEINNNYHERQLQKIDNKKERELLKINNDKEKELQKINNELKIMENYHERELQKINNMFRIVETKIKNEPKIMPGNINLEDNINKSNIFLKDFMLKEINNFTEEIKSRNIDHEEIMASQMNNNKLNNNQMNNTLINKSHG